LTPQNTVIPWFHHETKTKKETRTSTKTKVGIGRKDQDFNHTGEAGKGGSARQESVCGDWGND
jgi:hypothetical protein